MVVKVGINGFGRIGRLAFRRIQNVEGVEVTRPKFQNRRIALVPAYPLSPQSLW